MDFISVKELMMSYSEGGEHAGSASHFAGSSAAVGGEESRPTLFQTQARGPAPPSSPPPPPPLPSPPQPPRQLDTSSALAAVSAVVGEKGSVCFKDPTDLSPISFHGLSMGAYYTVAGEARPVFQEASFGKDDIGVYIEFEDIGTAVSIPDRDAPSVIRNLKSLFESCSVKHNLRKQSTFSHALEIGGPIEIGGPLTPEEPKIASPAKPVPALTPAKESSTPTATHEVTPEPEPATSPTKPASPTPEAKPSEETAGEDEDDGPKVSKALQNARNLEEMYSHTFTSASTRSAVTAATRGPEQQSSSSLRGGKGKGAKGAARGGRGRGQGREGSSIRGEEGARVHTGQDRKERHERRQDERPVQQRREKGARDETQRNDRNNNTNNNNTQRERRSSREAKALQEKQEAQRNEEYPPLNGKPATKAAVKEATKIRAKQ